MTSQSSKKIKSPKVAEEATIEEQYTKKTLHEHILSIPDTWIGSVKEDMTEMWVFDEINNRIVNESIPYISGFYKIFDEVVVNAFDHTIRDKTAKVIKIWINKETGEVTCYNDGRNGIPVEVHKEYNVYVPEMIFGQLMTSGNYDRSGKIVGGKNGLGAKLTNIYSSHFYIEVVDAKKKLKYQQHFYENMYKREEPIVTKVKENVEPYIMIKFTPAYNRFGVEKMTDGMYSLLKKRAYDIAANSHSKISVYLDDNLIEIEQFETYCRLFYDPEYLVGKFIYEECDMRKGEPNPRWRVGVVFDPNSGFRQISYVNGICTYQGGNHVNHVVTQVVERVAKHISTKYKNIKVKNSSIRDNLTFFISATIEDPEFQSQFKDYLKNPVKNFGSRYEMSDKFLKDLLKTDLVEEVVNMAKLKAMDEMKKSDGKKVQSLKGIPKLDDAHWAGTKKSKMCRLILTEGDSAKTFAMEGLAVIGRDKYGVFPLRGKLLNVREATEKQLLDNEEISNIKHILGLKHNKKYTDTSQLRYGGIIILTDQDVDGSHIKGLLMNFIHYFWPSLMKVDGFIQSMATPIIKAYKNTDVKKLNPKTFYTLKEYNDWKNSLGNKISGWKPKYYKGLGTSTPKEAKESFNDFDKKKITYVWDSLQKNPKTELIDIDEEEIEDVEEKEDTVVDEKSDDNDSDDYDRSSPSHNAMTLAFAKLRANDRKRWLESYNSNLILENDIHEVTIPDFINKDLIHFSNYDNQRSIPSILDGLKPSQRKIMYGTMLKKVWKEEIKVAQLAGYIGADTAYHHGEQSLHETIIGMAQDYVGSNNINLLMPNGAFGSRRLGGKDAASPRYIYTQLNPLVAQLFREEDDITYEYNDDDGRKIEPTAFVTVIPNILTNGTQGIGTGFSTNVASYNPRDLIANIKKQMNGEEPDDLIPWTRGFKGKIKRINATTFESHGTFEWGDDTIIVTELPIGKWTEVYKLYLDTLVADDPKKDEPGKIIKYYINDSGNNDIKFTIQFMPGVLQKLIRSDELEKVLKLKKSINISNMYLYDSSGKIKKYKDVVEIQKEFYQSRLKTYEIRKERRIRKYKNDLDLLQWRRQFLKDFIEGKIRLMEKQGKNFVTVKKMEVFAQLEKLNYPLLSTNHEAEEKDMSYDYLANIKIWDLTEENMEKLEEEYLKQLDIYETYKNTTIEQLWLNELNEFEAAYDKWSAETGNDEDDKKTKGKGTGKGTGKGKATGTAKGKGPVKTTAGKKKFA
jgi:DNA topoisomerase II